MTLKEKQQLIRQILIKLKTARALGMLHTPIDEGDMFFSLCFKSDAELKKIGKMLKL